MFYSQFILAKKGPLGTIWIAAHLERKLRRNQVTETNIGMSVDSILFPEVPIALRLSGHLLLGVVRIYSRKVNYLFHDCSEALVKIKQAFHSGLVDLPPEAATAPFHSITLPETFDLDEFELNPERESSFRANSSVDHHVISREQITLQDPLDDSIYLDSQFGLDERFADSDAVRMGLDFDEDLLFERPGKREPSPAPTTLIEDVIPATPADDPLDLQMMPATPEDDPLNLQTMPATPTDDSLDLQMMPATPADDALDFQPMDNDDQHEPSTPALASDMMDLDEHHQPSASVLGVDQMELEDRIEPSTTVQTLYHLGANQPESVQPASKNPELVERILSPIELREENLDNLTAVELPNREVLINENVLEHEPLKPAESSEAKKVNIDMEQLPSEKIQLCEYNLQTEKARSVVEVKEQELDAFVGAKDCVFEEHYIQDKAAEDNSKIAEDRREEAILKVTNDIGIQGVEKVNVLEETPMRDYSSSFPPRPMPYYSAPTPSTIKFSGDNDVLATILGRSTPAIRVAPTPSETPALKRRKPGPKPSVRKRKPIFDVSMVLHGEVMRQQQANTKDIRRSRKKAPCTMHEIWAVQKEALGQQAFYEPSFPGQSEKIQELYNRLFGVSGAKLSPASCDANLPHSEIVLEISVDKIEPARKFNNNGNSQPERNAEASVDITVTALPNLVESEPLDSDAVHSDARENEQEHKRATITEPIQSEAAFSELQAPCPIDVVSSSGTGPVLASPLMIEAETVQPMDVEQPLQDNGQDVQKQVDGETTVGEKDLRGVISSCKSTKLVEVVQEAVDKLENDIIPSSKILSMGEPSTLLPEPKNTDSEKEKNIIMEIESSISLQEVDKETKSILQHTYEETQEFVQEANRETELPIQEANKETELPIQEAKKEVKLPTPEASTEYKIPVQETNEETQMHLEASQMEIKIHAQETDKKSQIPVQEPGEKAQAPIQVEDEECQQDSDKEAQLPIQVAAKESELPQEAEKEKQLFMLETQASPILRPKDEAPEEVLEFLADTKYTDEYDFYDEGDDYDEDPEYDPETNVQDNNGWSVRTRAVSQYLRATFQALETDSKNLEEAGPLMLGLERLLLGKNRKEAARMFFETLVLKTKDYLDVQQNKPYDDIKISARAKLLKTDI